MVNVTRRLQQSLLFFCQFSDHSSWLLTLSGCLQGLSQSVLAFVTFCLYLCCLQKLHNGCRKMRPPGKASLQHGAWPGVSSRQGCSIQHLLSPGLPAAQGDRQALAKPNRLKSSSLPWAWSPRCVLNAQSPWHSSFSSRCLCRASLPGWEVPPVPASGRCSRPSSQGSGATPALCSALVTWALLLLPSLGSHISFELPQEGLAWKRGFCSLLRGQRACPAPLLRGRQVEACWTRP